MTASPRPLPGPMLAFDVAVPLFLVALYVLATPARRPAPSVHCRTHCRPEGERDEDDAPPPAAAGSA